MLIEGQGHQQTPGFTSTSAEVIGYPASLGVTCGQHVESPSRFSPSGQGLQLQIYTKLYNCLLCWVNTDPIHWLRIYFLLGIKSPNIILNILLNYHISITDEMISVRINLLFYLFFHRRPIQHLWDRKNFYTHKTCWKCCIKYERPTGKKHTNVG